MKNNGYQIVSETLKYNFAKLYKPAIKFAKKNEKSSLKFNKKWAKAMGIKK